MGDRAWDAPAVIFAHMTRTRSPLPGLALVTALALAGCGGGGDGKHLSKAEYLRRGNAICKRGHDELNRRAQAQFSASPSPNEIVDFGRATGIPIVEREINGIAALDAPKGDEGKVKKLVSDAQAALVKVKADPQLFIASGSASPFAQANREAKAYGLIECGK